MWLEDTSDCDGDGLGSCLVKAMVFPGVMDGCELDFRES